MEGSQIRSELLGAKFVKRSDVYRQGRCCVAGVSVPDCKYCQNPYLKEKDELGRDLMHTHDCPEMAEYACTIKDMHGTGFACGGQTALPLGFCQKHAVEHAKVHRIFSQRLDQAVKIFAVVYAD